MSKDKERRRCSGKSYHGRMGMMNCSRPASLQEGDRWWCATHAPSREKARKDNWEADYQAKSKRRREGWVADEKKAALDAHKIACFDELVGALKAIAAKRSVRNWSYAMDEVCGIADAAITKATATKHAGGG